MKREGVGEAHDLVCVGLQGACSESLTTKSPHPDTTRKYSQLQTDAFLKTANTHTNTNTTITPQRNSNQHVRVGAL